MAYIGKGVPGKLNHILVAGKGQYTADVSLPGMGFMTILRSPFAYAKITSIDVDAARRLNMDRAEVRCKNFISPDEFPYEQISGMRADSDNYAGALNIALEKIGYADFHKQQQEARKQGRYLGLGIGFELTPEGGCIPHSFITAYDRERGNCIHCNNHL